MVTTEQLDVENVLKERLLERIETTRNLGVLRGVLSHLDEIAGDVVYELTPEEREDVNEGIRQSREGLGIPYETVMAGAREWLRARQ